MCKYCDCDTKSSNGYIGSRIGGRAYPMFIKRYDDANVDFLDGRYWIVEGEKSSRTLWSGQSDYEYKLHRQIAIEYCPVCGKHLDTWNQYESRKRKCYQMSCLSSPIHTAAHEDVYFS